MLGYRVTKLGRPCPYESHSLSEQRDLKAVITMSIVRAWSRASWGRDGLWQAGMGLSHWERGVQQKPSVGVYADEGGSKWVAGRGNHPHEGSEARKGEKLFRASNIFSVVCACVCTVCICLGVYIHVCAHGKYVRVSVCACTCECMHVCICRNTRTSFSAPRLRWEVSPLCSSEV